MLSIRWGTTEDTIVLVDSVFDNNYEEEWFADSLVKEMIYSVDKSEVLSPQCIQSPVLGQIPPTMLSGGVKALIMALKTDWEIWASACGDNCSEWFLKIGEMKDLTISIEHFFKFPETKFKFIDATTGEMCDDYMDFIVKYHEQCRKDNCAGRINDQSCFL